MHVRDGPGVHAGWLQRLFVPKGSRLLGTHVLRVEPATAPSNYIYENLAISPLSRTARVALSNAIVSALLILALVVVILLKSYQKTLLVRPPPSGCHSGFPDCWGRYLSCS